MIWTIIYQPLLTTINNYQPLLPLLTIMNQPLLTISNKYETIMNHYQWWSP